MYKPSHDAQTSLNDLLFNMLLLFIAMTALLFMLINVKKKKHDVENKAEFIITLEWDSKVDDDIDLWLRDPTGHTVWFQQKTGPVSVLERDDLGYRNDSFEYNGEQITYDQNREMVTIRKSIEGRYNINIHAYTKRSIEPTKCSVRIEKINPYKLIFIKEFELEGRGDKMTNLNFELDKDGDVINVDEEDIDIINIVTSPREEFE